MPNMPVVGSLIGPFNAQSGGAGFAPIKFRIAGTAITATTAATANAVGTLTRNVQLAAFISSCNLPVTITLGTTAGNGVDLIDLEAGNAIVLDLTTNKMRFGNGLIIGAYNYGGTPASGTLRVTLL